MFFSNPIFRSSEDQLGYCLTFFKATFYFFFREVIFYVAANVLSLKKIPTFQQILAILLL